MSTKNKTNIHLELTQELYRTFDFFNEECCQGKLPRPVITVATKGRQAAHGWFCNSIWKQGDGEILHEIQMCGESLNRGAVDSIGTLVHEMAHLKNFVDNDNQVVDCTPQQRHNKKFKVTAEFFGLTVTSSQRFGFAHTVPGEKCLKVIERLKPREDLYKLYRESFNSTKEKKTWGKLKPVMVDEETKEMITKGAEELGMSQKEFTQAAAKLYVSLQKKAEELGEYIFNQKKKYKTAMEVTADIIDVLDGQTNHADTEEE